MFRKICAALAAIALIGALPFAVSALSTSDQVAACCACCGPACACSDCRCDELGCACAASGPCLCAAECLDAGGCQHGCGH
jgi:hypothetical protein